MRNEITISIDSGANIHSKNTHTVSPEDLGFESMEEWESACDGDKLNAVQEYFYAQGCPEWSWE